MAGGAAYAAQHPGYAESHHLKNTATKVGRDIEGTDSKDNADADSHSSIDMENGVPYGYAWRDGQPILPNDDDDMELMADELDEPDDPLHSVPEPFDPDVLQDRLTNISSGQTRTSRRSRAPARRHNTSLQIDLEGKFIPRHSRQGSSCLTGRSIQSSNSNDSSKAVCGDYSFRQDSLQPPSEYGDWEFGDDEGQPLIEDMDRLEGLRGSCHPKVFGHRTFSVPSPAEEDGFVQIDRPDDEIKVLLVGRDETDSFRFQNDDEGNPPPDDDDSASTTFSESSTPPKVSPVQHRTKGDPPVIRHVDRLLTDPSRFATLTDPSRFATLSDEPRSEAITQITSSPTFSGHLSASFPKPPATEQVQPTHLEPRVWSS